MKGLLSTINKSGDLRIEWDSEIEEEVAVAREAFDKKIKAGWSAFSEKKKGEKGNIIKEFDPESERIILIPPASGG
jgi:hypothetical protein